MRAYAKLILNLRRQVSLLCYRRPLKLYQAIQCYVWYNSIPVSGEFKNSAFTVRFDLVLRLGQADSPQ